MIAPARLAPRPSPLVYSSLLHTDHQASHRLRKKRPSTPCVILLLLLVSCPVIWHAQMLRKSSSSLLVADVLIATNAWGCKEWSHIVAMKCIQGVTWVQVWGIFPARGTQKPRWWEWGIKCSRGCRHRTRGHRGSCQWRQQGVTEYKPPLNTLTCHLNCSNCQLHGPIRRGSLSTQPRQETRAARHLKFKSSFQIFQIQNGDNGINYVGWGRWANSYREWNKWLELPIRGVWIGVWCGKMSLP